MDEEQDQAVAAAERALGTDLSDVTPLSEPERRNIVLRARTPTRAVIIKATRDQAYDGRTAGAFDFGLVKEWIATAFLARNAPGIAPSFIAGDATRGLVVLEDFGANLGSLVDPLRNGPTPAAEQALMAYASAMGRLHAATLSCIGRHADILRRDFPAASVKPPAGGAAWREAVVDKVVSLLGTIPPASEITWVADRMAEPGPWLGLAHRDGCPDNVLLSGSRAHLIDFEFAGPGHILLDAAYWRMGFPTCWCAGRVPDEVIAAMDRAYRAELRSALPIVADDGLFRQEMAIFLFVRMFASLSLLLEGALQEDRYWGISTSRPRILWHLDAAIAGAADAPSLAGLRATATAWRDDLARHWPDAEPLAFYPAFRD